VSRGFDLGAARAIVQLRQGALRMRAQAFGLWNVGSCSQMKSKLTVPNVVCGFLRAEQV
jgi:hypothetical protein